MRLSGHRVFFKLNNGFISIEGSGWRAGDKLTRASLLTAGDTVKAVMTEASEPEIIKKEDKEKKPRFPTVGYALFDLIFPLIIDKVAHYAHAKCRILYKDQNLLAVFKPQGVPVHEGTRKHFDTLLTRLYENHGFEQGDLRPVHRLDKVI